jgi:hypothetical protein
VHEALQYDGVSPVLDAPFEHANNPTLVHKQLKVLRYAELKCRDWHERGKPVRMWQAPFIYLATFIKDYLLRLACMDGWRGFIIARTAASYALYKRMRYYEMHANPSSIAQGEAALTSHRIER